MSTPRSSRFLIWFLVAVTLFVAVLAVTPAPQPPVCDTDVPAALDRMSTQFLWESLSRPFVADKPF